MPPSDKKGNGTSPFLFFIILGIIVAAILAFLILRPHPSKAGITPNPSSPPTAQH